MTTITLTLYLAAMVGLGYWACRRKVQGTPAEFSMGGHYG